MEIKKRPPCPLQNAAKEFRNDLTIYNLQKEKLRCKDATHASLLLPESPVSLPLSQKQIGASSLPQNIRDPSSLLLQNIDDPDMKVLGTLLLVV
jgi:hypothetical protein